MSTTRIRLISIIAIVFLAAAAIAFAGFADTEVYLPAVGAAPGVPPAVWYTTVWVHNPSSTRADVTFALLERRANPSPLTFTDSIPPGDTRRYDNAVETLFGLQTFGAIRVTANVAVVVGSRIYSQPGAALEDSSGQFFAAVPASFSIGAGESTEIVGGWQTRPTADSAFRFNYGFVETTGTGTCQVEVAAKDETGATLATKSYTLGQWEQLQKAFANEFPAVSSDNVRLTVTVTSGKGRVIAFGSSVSNGLDDPSTLEMRFADSAARGQLGRRHHHRRHRRRRAHRWRHDGQRDPRRRRRRRHRGRRRRGFRRRRRGDDAEAAAAAVERQTPLGHRIADGAVTPAKVSTAGGSDGQVLTVTPSGAAWQAVSGGAGGDITAVNAGAGLSGRRNHRRRDPVDRHGGIATAMVQDAAVTAAKLSPAGGAAGNILKHTGSAVVWGTENGFSLPFHGSADSASPLFLWVENTSNGTAIIGQERRRRRRHRHLRGRPQSGGLRPGSCGPARRRGQRRLNGPRAPPGPLLSRNAAPTAFTSDRQLRLPRLHRLWRARPSRRRLVGRRSRHHQRRLRTMHRRRPLRRLLQRPGQHQRQPLQVGRDPSRSTTPSTRRTATSPTPSSSRRT